MPDWKIVKLTPDQFLELDTVAKMKNRQLADKWYEALKEGNRIAYAYVVDDVCVGEVSLVFIHEDPVCVIPGRRAYMQRLIVTDAFRGKGIGKKLVAHLCEEALSMGIAEISVSVDKDNAAALHIYRSSGFDAVLFDGEDRYGPCYKLMKKLKNPKETQK